MGVWRKLGNPNWNSIHEFSERIEDILELTTYDADSLSGPPSRTLITRTAIAQEEVSPGNTGHVTARRCGIDRYISKKNSLTFIH